LSTEAKTAYPLTWPPGFHRCTSRARGSFQRRNLATARDELLAELRRLRVTDLILSTNIRINSSGFLSGDAAMPKDPGVAVYFKWRGKPRVLACDRWQHVDSNLHAIELTIAALRGLERWGASDILERAFTGLTALPAPPQDSWETVLGVHRDWRLDAIEERYRELIRKAHPDAGGSNDQAQRLTWAIAEARRAKGAA
jgi:hypothetical protein